MDRELLPVSSIKSINIGWLFALLPLLWFVVDVVRLPITESKFDLELVSITELFRGVVELGKLHLHDLRVSMGRIGDPEYLSKLDGKSNALALSAYPGKDADHVGLGTFGEAVRASLPEEDNKKLLKLLRDTRESPPGKVGVFVREQPRAAGPLSKIDYIFILRALPGSSSEAKNALRTGLLNLLNETAGWSVTGLIIPTLTISPNANNSPTFYDFFTFLFEALRASQSPRTVDVTLHNQWPDDFLRSAVLALNGQWSAEVRTLKGGLPRIYRLDFRLVLFGLAVCLFICSFHTKVDLKSFIIIGSAYIVALLAAFKTIEWMPQDYANSVGLPAKVVFALVEALGFPYFAKWQGIKDIFKVEGKP